MRTSGFSFPISWNARLKPIREFFFISFISVWYIPKQLFTSASVNNEGYLSRSNRVHDSVHRPSHLESDVSIVTHKEAMEPIWLSSLSPWQISRHQTQTVVPISTSKDTLVVHIYVVFPQHKLEPCSLYVTRWSVYELNISILKASFA